MTSRTLHRSARVRASTFDAGSNTIEVVWSTGASVRRTDYWTGDDYDEVLSMEPGSVRLGRLNGGAALLDTHDSSELSRVIGSVVKGSAKIVDGRGVATVRLTTAKGAADIVTKIREGVITSISVGYLIHSQTETEADGLRTVTATDWEPLEISAVPVPADPGAMFRNARRQTGRVAARGAQDPMAKGAAEACALLSPPARVDTDRERGARAARVLLGRGQMGDGAGAQRREAERRAQQRVDDALDRENGRREAEKLLRRKA